MCEERDRLVESFFDAVEIYSNAVSSLRGSCGSDSVYGLEKAQRARQDCERWRREIEFHDAVHGCSLQPETRKLALKDD